jgi:hypothetical protein
VPRYWKCSGSLTFEIFLSVSLTFEIYNISARPLWLSVVPRYWKFSGSLTFEMRYIIHLYICQAFMAQCVVELFGIDLRFQACLCVCVCVCVCVCE